MQEYGNYLNHQNIISEYTKLIEKDIDRRHRVALYVRLSREDEDKDNEKESSESIKNQIEFLLNYCKQYSYMIIDIYSDDGISRNNL